ncbi:thioredoxin family protein [Hamadaea tsunoensis]|uniref:thioredoxin family protein n=1 Tax=Hamadaea tsunoensis TaxID=53368 RepID=UPI000411207D|nr:thioredoxin family protein [Hamadaea tsunoensis]
MPLVSLLTVAVALSAATGLGLAWKRRNGDFREAAVTGTETETLRRLGWTPGTPVTLLQFSSAFCAPCRATRVLCEQASSTIDGVRHVEVDAESHLDAVRSLDIMRTPTVLLVDARGSIVRRASGQPTKAQLVGAISLVNNQFTTAP